MCEPIPDLAQTPPLIQHPHAPQLGTICQIILAWGKLFWAQTSMPAVGGKPPHAGTCTQMCGCPPPPACCILHFCCFEPTSHVTLAEAGVFAFTLSHLCPRTPLPGHPLQSLQPGTPGSGHSLIPHSGRRLTPALQGHDQTDPLPICPESSHTHCSHWSSPVIIHGLSLPLSINTPIILLHPSWGVGATFRSHLAASPGALTPPALGEDPAEQAGIGRRITRTGAMGKAQTSQPPHTPMGP